jgi:sulfate adenylyltransferase subunit 2
MTAVLPTQSDSLERGWLTDLEDEAIHIIREVVGQFERPVLLFSGGKDSIVMAHLAMKAFWPSRLPFALMQWGVKLIVASVQDAIDAGRITETPGQTRNPLQTIPLLDAITSNKFDAVLGGARRDEEKARAKERVFSVRDDFGQWDPRNQRPELWDLYNGRHRTGEHVRVFPLSNWTELDIWAYIEREGIEVPNIYYAHQREVVDRDGMLLAITEFTPPREGETVRTESVRYRTVGDATCTGAVASIAGSVADIITETAASTISERGATRADDRASEAAMEDRKRQGYF